MDPGPWTLSLRSACQAVAAGRANQQRNQQGAPSMRCHEAVQASASFWKPQGSEAHPRNAFWGKAHHRVRHHKPAQVTSQLPTPTPTPTRGSKSMRSPAAEAEAEHPFLDKLLAFQVPRYQLLPSFFWLSVVLAGDACDILSLHFRGSKGTRCVGESSSDGPAVPGIWNRSKSLEYQPDTLFYRTLNVTFWHLISKMGNLLTSCAYA